jgi:5-methylcytosine-specific restriction endonuclease McrA
MPLRYIHNPTTEAERSEKNAYQRLWRAKNKDKCAAYNAKRYLRDRKEILARVKSYRQKNISKCRTWGLRYYYRRIGTPNVPCEVIERAAIYIRDRGICHICKDKVKLKDYHLDHIHPLSKGGLHIEQNVAVSHSWCNLKKGARILHGTI